MDVVSLGYRTDLALREAGGSLVEDRGDHLVVRSPHNPDHYWGNFLLVAAPPTPWDPQRWLPVFREAFPDAGHVALGFDGAALGVEALDAYAALGEGLVPEEAVVMTATAVHEPPRPNRDAQYRRFASDDDWAQSVELQVLTKDDGLDAAGYRAFAVARTATNRELVERGLGAWWGAFVDGRLVSQMGLLTASPGLARFQSVMTDPSFRGRGLAGTLVHATARYGFDELAAHTLVMVADPTYLAIRVYRSVGFADTERQLQVERRRRPSAT